MLINIKVLSNIFEKFFKKIFIVENFFLRVIEMALFTNISNKFLCTK